MDQKAGNKTEGKKSLKDGKKKEGEGRVSPLKKMFLSRGGKVMI